MEDAINGTYQTTGIDGIKVEFRDDALLLIGQYEGRAPDPLEPHGEGGRPQRHVGFGGPGYAALHTGRQAACFKPNIFCNIFN